jgi:hypothetical protein
MAGAGVLVVVPPPERMRGFESALGREPVWRGRSVRQKRAWKANGHLEKSRLACRDWPARSVRARDFPPGRQEEAECFEVP